MSLSAGYRSCRKWLRWPSRALQGIFFYSFIIITSLFLAQNVPAQELHGQVLANGQPVAFATIMVLTTNIGTTSDVKGHYHLKGLKPGSIKLLVRSVGYQPLEKAVVLKANQTTDLDLELVPDVLGTSVVTVTAGRQQVSRDKTAVIVNVVSAKQFGNVQAVSLGDGLSFSPGLRVENNCQNCGFSSVRLNGLQGPYSQLLINSRPVYSALTSVYGLDQIPASLIDRVEVVRGAGSVLYGGNAIAGTINILTKDPLFNGWQAGSTLNMIGGAAPDLSTYGNGSFVSADDKTGISLYGMTRNRAEYDANGDGYSEITRLRNQTFGFNGFYKLSPCSKLNLTGFALTEYRRGGNNLDLPPHQTDIAEELKTNAYNLGANYEYLGRRYNLSAYGSVQLTDRNSYYGGGGRVLGPADTLSARDLLALNAYGKTTDLIGVVGLQFSSPSSSSDSIVRRLGWTVGTEWQHNKVDDQMPGYRRLIVQQTNTIGLYGQVTYALTPSTSVVGGLRLDMVSIDGRYQYGLETPSANKRLLALVPRIAILQTLGSSTKIRLGYAQGYRAPQAFDEDLHIETVSGTARFVQLSPDLVPERSHSFTASIDKDFRTGEMAQNILLEGFATLLPNAFVNTDVQISQAGYATWLKQNGQGLSVYGMNLEWRLKHDHFPIDLVLGGTLQQAIYKSPLLLWQGEAIASRSATETKTSRLLRTPDIYGFATAEWRILPKLKANLTSVFTGAMVVAHQVEPETGYILTKTTPAFAELNLRIGYKVNLADDLRCEVIAGCQNLLNQYQRDFDQGAMRDASYIYGPSRPTTVYIGVKLGNFLGN